MRLVAEGLAVIEICQNSAIARAETAGTAVHNRIILRYAHLIQPVYTPLEYRQVFVPVEQTISNSDSNRVQYKTCAARLLVGFENSELALRVERLDGYLLPPTTDSRLILRDRTDVSL